MPIILENGVLEFSNSDDRNEVFEQAKAIRDLQMQRDSKIFNEEQCRQDNERISKTLEFLFVAGGDFKGYIASKPEVENWRDALNYWVNNEGELGVGEKNPVKSLVYKKKDSNEVVVVVMPNDLDLPKDFLKKNKLERYNFPEDEGVVIPRTINPGTVTMLNKPVFFAIHDKMSEVGYCCNNLGSRYLSYSVDAQHHSKSMNNLTAHKFYFDGTTTDFKEKFSTRSEAVIADEKPSSIVESREEKKGFQVNHFAGDYFKYGRE